MKKCLLILFGFYLSSGWVLGQDRTVTGTVTNDDGESLPGVNVVLQGTSVGTVSDVQGEYSLKVPSDGGSLVFSFIGYATEEIQIGNRSVIDVTMAPDMKQLNEVVVTAIGIERDKKSLGYAVEEVSGDEVSTAKEASFISSLSGKVSGLSVKKSNNLGGSINAIIRGSSSFLKDNQALFVVDGVPISNSNVNTADQQSGGGGYDYGNAASNIDPESIETISVLKGAAAAALYGSQGANGVILITTKKGAKSKGIGVTLSHATTFSNYDKSTFPEYQFEYGAGYGPYYGSTGGFYDVDVDGDGTDDLVVPSGEDASFGAAFDPNLLVYQWDSFYPELDSYLQPRPWTAPTHGPGYIFETGLSNITSISLDGGNEAGTFRLGYTNDDRSGILPNSEINTDLIDLHASYNLSDRLTVTGKATFTNIEGKGRYGTGYESRNVMQSFRQWFEMNVDLKAQEQAYLKTRRNITWNTNDHIDTSPHYFDNPYWVMYENFETDNRTRFFGKFQADYKINDWLSLMGRIGIDTYSDLQEERFAKGSLDQSKYIKFQRTYQLYNSDVMLNFNRDISPDLSFRGLLGFNLFNEKINSTRASTNGGLVVDRIYALSNSVSALTPPTEYDAHKRKYGYYAQASFGYKDMLFLEGTGRIDQSSALPEDANTYFYPSITGSFVFTEILNSPVLNFGKLRAGYAEVGNDASVYSVNNTFTAASPFGSTPLFYVDDISNNPELKSERTREIEVGLEFGLFQNRLGGDISFYKRNTIDQIFAVEVSMATGFNDKFVNAGEMENKGVEIGLYGRPIQTSDFSWQINLNWAKNQNNVLSLYEDSKNLLIFSQWSTAINARVGQPYGTITGTDYVYDQTTGKRVVGSDGKYLMSESTTEVIGNIQPDWIGGVSNSFNYKGLSLSFLIDIQKGGDIINYDMGFGGATGILAETAGLNDLGNPKRDPVVQNADGTYAENSGGIILDGVKENGEPNDIRADASTYETPYGYYGGSAETGGYAPDASLVYDASYIKLRELTLNYRLPNKLFNNIFLSNATIGVYGRNLWIIHKNLPYGDPEYNPTSGNIQGIQNAALPATNEYGFNINFQF